MKINKIQIKNFQSYFGELQDNVFEFEPGVNIIAGKNGSGKSKLFNAFHWCLFGSIYSTVSGGWKDTDSLGTQFVNKHARQDPNEDEEIEVAVELDLTAQNYLQVKNEVDYNFRRSLKVKFINDSWQMVSPESLTISFVNENGETIYANELQNEEALNKIFPKAIRKYMWFQGETIDELLDFNNPTTLKRAIQNISYYPYYERLSKIAALANTVISGKINKHIKKQNRDNKSLRSLIEAIEQIELKLKSKKEDVEKCQVKLEMAEEEMVKKEGLLKSYDHFPDLKKKIDELDYRDKLIANKIEQLSQEYRTKFVDKWMLKGTGKILKRADEILDQFMEQVKNESESENPVPLQIPGKKYIEQMLKDEYCYICEREAHKDSPEYKSIQKRIGESEKAEEQKQIYKQLEYNYIQLRNKPQELKESIKEIESEMKSWSEAISGEFHKRRKIKDEKEELKSESNIPEAIKGAAKASDLTKELLFYKNEQQKWKNRIESITRDISGYKDELESKKIDRKKHEQKDDIIPEQRAEPYFKLLEDMVDELKETALKKLLKNIEERANSLYRKYLENSESPEGYLQIDPERYEVLVLDRGEIKDINQGHEIAAKMSVINAILSLSAEKIGKDYPLIADAPSSVFDRDNTRSYTEKISETFNQVIVISKDYSNPSELEFLTGLDSVSKIYEIRSIKIDESAASEEANHKTVIKLVK